jgi:hypothetical protein
MSGIQKEWASTAPTSRGYSVADARIAVRIAFVFKLAWQKRIASICTRGGGANAPQDEPGAASDERHDQKQY